MPACNSRTLLFLLLQPRVAKHCNERVCVRVCMYVYMSVCLSVREHISRTARVLYQFLRLLPIAVDRSSSSRLTKYYRERAILFFPC